MDISEQEISVLESAPTRQLAEWYCELNRWRWPAELGEPEAVPKARHERSPRRTAIMAWVDERLNPKFINRIWNSYMTDAEHEEWWVTKQTPQSVKDREFKKLR